MRLVFSAPMAADRHVSEALRVVAGLMQVGELATVVLAVMVPCCVSDVVFPLLFVRHADGSPYSPLELKRET